MDAKSDICLQSQGRARTNRPQCARAVISAMAPLLVKKMVIAALALPAMTVLSWQVAASGTCMQHRRCSCVAARLLRRRPIRLDNVVAQVLTWLDIALVFGPQMPLLVPLAVMAIVGMRWRLHVGVGKFGMQQVAQEESVPAVWSVILSLLAQQGLNVWLYVKTHGMTMNDVCF